MVLSTRNFEESPSSVTQTFEAVIERNIIQREATRLWKSIDLDAQDIEDKKIDIMSLASSRQIPVIIRGSIEWERLTSKEDVLDVFWHHVRQHLVFDEQQQRFLSARKQIIEKKVVNYWKN